MASIRPQDDPVARRAADEVRRIFGDRVEGVLLFGSRARGDERVDSDYDIAVFLAGQTIADEDRLVDIAWDLQKATGAVISFQAFPPARQAPPTVFLSAVRDEGIGL